MTPKTKNEPMRLVNLMNQAPRCGARNRRGRPCQAPAVKGRTRCRLHGGALGSGAQPGNKNALKTGRHTAEANVWRRQIRELLQESRKVIKAV